MNFPTFPNYRISFDEFILENRDSIRKAYFTKIYKTISSVNGDKMVEDMQINDKELKKWYLMIDPLISNLQIDKYNKDLICIYCEVLYTYKKNFSNSTNIDIENELRQLLVKIIPNKRSKIIDKYYNYKTGKVEYLLEDGNHVPLEENVGKVDINITNDMLPIQILSIIDIKEYRNQQINRII